MTSFPAQTLNGQTVRIVRKVSYGSRQILVDRDGNTYVHGPGVQITPFELPADAEVTQEPKEETSETIGPEEDENPEADAYALAREAEAATETPAAPEADAEASSDKGDGEDGEEPPEAA